MDHDWTGLSAHMEPATKGDIERLERQIRSLQQLVLSMDRERRSVEFSAAEKLHELVLAKRQGEKTRDGLVALAFVWVSSYSLHEHYGVPFWLPVAGAFILWGLWKFFGWLRDKLSPPVTAG